MIKNASWKIHLWNRLTCVGAVSQSSKQGWIHYLKDFFFFGQEICLLYKITRFRCLTFSYNEHLMKNSEHFRGIVEHCSGGIRNLLTVRSYWEHIRGFRGVYLSLSTQGYLESCLITHQNDWLSLNLYEIAYLFSYSINFWRHLYHYWI